MCVCVRTPQSRCVCDTFPKPVVIGESLQRIPASSLVAALRWQWRQEARVKRRELEQSVSEAPRHRRRCPGRQLSGGWKKTSVNVSLARDFCAAGNKDGAARRE